MIITIGGPPGSGKTTVARILSERLSKELIVIGEIFRGLAKERGCTLAEFGELASKDHSIDTELDKRTIKIAKKGNLILEGRLAGIMLHRAEIPSFKVWLNAELETRAERINKREGGDLQRVVNLIKEREQCERERYRDIYGISMDEREFYDIVIDTTNIPAHKVATIILQKLKV